MYDKAINALAYVGTASMIAAPWSGDLVFLALVFGLALVTPQAIYLRAWNLVILNLSGIAGYLWRIFQ